MATTIERERQRWREHKAKIIARVGSISGLARKLECSTQAIRLAALGKGCPKVASRMKEALR